MNVIYCILYVVYIQCLKLATNVSFASVEEGAWQKTLSIVLILDCWSHFTRFLLFMIFYFLNYTKKFFATLTRVIFLSHLFGWGFICVPRSRLVNGCLSPSDTWSQARASGLVLPYCMHRDLDQIKQSTPDKQNKASFNYHLHPHLNPTCHTVVHHFALLIFQHTLLF